MESDIWCAALCSVVFMASGMYIILLCKLDWKRGGRGGGQGGEETLRSYKGALLIFEIRIKQRGE